MARRVLGAGRPRPAPPTTATDDNGSLFGPRRGSGFNYESSSSRVGVSGRSGSSGHGGGGAGHAGLKGHSGSGGQAVPLRRQDSASFIVAANSHVPAAIGEQGCVVGEAGGDNVDWAELDSLLEGDDFGSPEEEEEEEGEEEKDRGTAAAGLEIGSASAQSGSVVAATAAPPSVASIAVPAMVAMTAGFNGAPRPQESHLTAAGSGVGTVDPALELPVVTDVGGPSQRLSPSGRDAGLSQVLVAKVCACLGIHLPACSTGPLWLLVCHVASSPSLPASLPSPLTLRICRAWSPIRHADACNRIRPAGIRRT